MMAVVLANAMSNASAAPVTGMGNRNGEIRMVFRNQWKRCGVHS